MDTNRRPVRRPPLRGVVLALGLAGALALGSAAPSAGIPRDTAPPSRTWGQTQTYSDGLGVTVAQPTPFTPSGTAAGHREGHQAVAWKITLRNGTPEPFKAALVSVYAKYGTAGEQAEAVFDSANGVGSSFEGSISPGRSATVTYVFDIPRNGTGTLDLEVVPNVFDYEGTHWSGPLNTPAGRS
ncbi:hypothetical protein ACFRJ1_29935 [Streptomyces sp. NPDC056773]|uniref:hypothetical protein n=1 Tax=unclassified Streptomyces TaxID=2593676 RepID=UPI0036818AF1